MGTAFSLGRGFEPRPPYKKHPLTCGYAGRGVLVFLVIHTLFTSYTA